MISDLYNKVAALLNDEPPSVELVKPAEVDKAIEDNITNPLTDEMVPVVEQSTPGVDMGAITTDIAALKESVSNITNAIATLTNSLVNNAQSSTEQLLEQPNKYNYDEAVKRYLSS